MAHERAFSNAGATVDANLAMKALGVKLLGRVTIPEKSIQASTNARDLRGMKSNYLTALCPTGLRQSSAVAWLCRCECGEEVLISASRFLLGRAKSCGCKTSYLIGKRLRRHGLTESPTWKSWKSMMDRCYLPAHKSYKDYGGRGIAVCERWGIFENFLADMGERPAGLTLERMNNSGDYEPGNCRWASRKEQANNRRSSNLLSMGGLCLTVAQWAEKTGIPSDTIARRISLGWSAERALSKPVRKQRNNRRIVVGVLQ